MKTGNRRALRRVGLVLALMLAACGGGDDGGGGAEGGDGPDPAVQAELDWFLGVMGGAEMTQADYDARVNETFRGQVPFDDFSAVVDQLRTGAPYELQEVTPRGSKGVTAVAAAVEGTRVEIVLDLDDAGLIGGLLVRPAEPAALEDAPASPEEAADQLEELGTLRMVVAEGSDCSTELDRDAEDVAPIASVFKLYVLAALAEAVAAGAVSWDEPLTITEELKSLPTGVLQDRPAGSTVTVQEAAELMISISDNTATDLLMRRLGREAVEAAQESYGHHDPDLNRPFPTTLEMFALKVAAEDVRQAWIDGGESERRTILADLTEVTVADIPLEAFGNPLAPDRIEWFASPADLCHVLTALVARSADAGLEPLLPILTANPGVPSDDGRWTTVAFKGGSEPGLAVAAWLVQDAGGAQYVVAGSVVNPDTTFDITQAVLLLAAARDSID